MSQHFPELGFEPESSELGHLLNSVQYVNHYTIGWIIINSTSNDVIVFDHVSRVEEGRGVAEESRDTYATITLGGLLTVFALVTVLGNSLVIAAVLRERYLRTVTNYFIVSLAVSDLLIGTVVMPFSIALEIQNGKWMFGPDWCDLWHSFDVLASTASILNLSMISLDRYWAITDPIAYPRRMSSTRSACLVTLVWVSSAAISFPAIAWWRHVTPPSQSGDDVCHFTNDSGYLIFSSVVSFYLPVSVIMFAYYRIYVAATAQTRGLITGHKVMTSTRSKMMPRVKAITSCRRSGAGKISEEGEEGIGVELMALRVHKGCYKPAATQGSLSEPQGKNRHLSRSSNVIGGSDDSSHVDSDGESTSTMYDVITSSRPINSSSSMLQPERAELLGGRAGSIRYNSTATLHGTELLPPVGTRSPSPLSPRRRCSATALSRKWASATLRRKIGKVAKERKAAKTLGVVIGVFCICWVPFFITNFTYGICHDACVLYADVLFPVFTWLGYINSCMNPVIYAYSMRDFRRAFYKIMCSGCPAGYGRTARRSMTPEFSWSLQSH